MRTLNLKTIKHISGGERTMIDYRVAYNIPPDQFAPCVMVWVDIDADGNITVIEPDY